MASLSPPEPEWIDLRATDEPRLSAPPFFRISGATMLGCMTGGILGISYGGQNAALRFRAENAHRLPTTSKGWYFYHKSKNYKVMYGGIKEGFRMGAKIGFWVGSFFALETIIDNGREGRKDFVSTTGAGLATAGAFSLWSKSSD